MFYIEHIFNICDTYVQHMLYIYQTLFSCSIIVKSINNINYSTYASILSQNRNTFMFYVEHIFNIRYAYVQHMFNVYCIYKYSI